MVDVSDSKSDGGDTVWVQVPPQAPLEIKRAHLCSLFCYIFVIIFIDNLFGGECMEKSMEQMQKDVDVWAHQFEKPYFSQLSMIATMVEELGEVARVVNIMYGDKNKKDSEALKNLQEEPCLLIHLIL